MSNFYFTTFRDGHLVTGRTNLILQGTTNTTLPTTLPPTTTTNPYGGSWYFGNASVGAIINPNDTTTTTTVGAFANYPERQYEPSTVFWEGSGDIGETPVEWSGTTFKGRDFPVSYQTEYPIIYTSDAFAISNGKGISSLYTEVWTNSGNYFSTQDWLAQGAIVYIAMSTDGTTFGPWYYLGRTAKYKNNSMVLTNGEYYFPTQNVANSGNATHFRIRIRADRGFDEYPYSISALPFGIHINKTYRDGTPLEIYPGAVQLPEPE